MEIIVIMIAGFTLFVAEGLLYKHIWHRGLEAELTVAPDHAFCGDKGRLNVKIENRKIIPLPWLWVKFNISSNLRFDELPPSRDTYTYYNALFCIMGWQRVERELHFTAMQRGYYTLKDFHVIGTSILFNGKRSKGFTSSASITVYPELLGEQNLDALLLSIDGVASATNFALSDPFEFAGIREYMPHDSLREINFKASAHMNKLMSNKYYPTVKGRLSIILCFDKLSSNYSFETARNEYAISLAATVADRFIRLGCSVEIKTNAVDAVTRSGIIIDEATGESHLRAIYEALARLDYSETTSHDELYTDYYKPQFTFFISLGAGKEVAKLYANVKQYSEISHWFLPVMEFDLPRTEAPYKEIELIGVPAYKQKYED